MSNVLKTGLLLGVLTALLVLAGQAIAGERGMIIAFVLAAIMNFVSYWFSDKLVLAMYGAQPVDEAQAPRLHAIVRRLATRAQIPMPRIYMIPSDTPNAFATGRNPQHAAGAGPRRANPAPAHLFIVNPLPGQSFARLFSTHPPTEERIARLRAMRLG